MGPDDRDYGPHVERLWQSSQAYGIAAREAHARQRASRKEVQRDHVKGFDRRRPPSTPVASSSLFEWACTYRIANFSLGGPAVGNRSPSSVALREPSSCHGWRLVYDLRLRYIIPDPNPHYHLRAPASTRPVTAASPGIPPTRKPARPTA